MHGEPLQPEPRTPEEDRDRADAERRGLPFLLYRGADGEQVVVELPEDRGSLTIGRRATNDVALPWDNQVSRLHAELVPMGSDWVLCDDGVSHNGTFVNGARVRGRRRLRGGDAISVGDTLIAFCAPESASAAPTTPRSAPMPPVVLTASQRRVLAAL